MGLGIGLPAGLDITLLRVCWLLVVPGWLPSANAEEHTPGSVGLHHVTVRTEDREDQVPLPLSYPRSTTRRYPFVDVLDLKSDTPGHDPVHDVATRGAGRARGPLQFGRRRIGRRLRT